MKILFFCLLFLCTLGVVVCSIVLPVHKAESVIQGVKKSGSGESISLPGGIGSNGEFYASVGLGTPPQYFDFQVDTGSADMAVYGYGCSSCAYTYQFSVTSSSSLISCSNPNYRCETCVNAYSTNACGFNDSYGSGASISGFVLTDYLTLGDFSGVSVDFGFIQLSQTGANNAGLEHAPVDGIWGLAGQSLSGWLGTPAMDSIVGQLGLYNAFSMCLVGGGSGVMSIGIDYSTDNQFTWVNLLGNLYYPVNMTDFAVGSTSLGYGADTYNGGTLGAIVDSGTTLLLIPPNAYTSFENTLLGMCPGLHGICDVSAGNRLFDGVCYSFTNAQLDAYPTVTVFINGIPFVIQPDAYLYTFNSYRCLGVANGINGFGSILGDVFMQNWHVAFDRTSSRIGFAPLSTCPSAGATATGSETPVTTGQGSGQGSGQSGTVTSASAGPTSSSGNIVSLGTYLPSGFNYQDIHTYPVWAWIVIGLVGAFIIVAVILCCCYACAPSRRGNNW